MPAADRAFVLQIGNDEVGSDSLPNLLAAIDDAIGMLSDDETAILVDDSGNPMFDGLPLTASAFSALRARIAAALA